ncbi:MAG: FtsX-like permease family protein [Clostridium sp.]
MESYKRIIDKNLNSSKRKRIYTTLGIILTYILFVSLVGTIFLFNNILRENAYKKSGNYTLVINDLNNNKLDIIRNNVEVKTSGVIKNIENSNVEGSKEQINLFALDKVSMTNLINKRIDLLYGKYPLKKNEIILTKRAETIFDKGIGDDIVVNGESYEVVGTYAIFHSEQPKIEAMTINNIKGEKGETSYLLVKLKNHKNIGKFVETVKKYNPNAKVAYNKADMDYHKGSKTLLIIDILVNIFCIYLIYCTLNLRVRESKHDLIILRYIGCTREKIMYMAFKRNYKLLIYTSILGSILGIIVFRFLIAPLIIRISQGFGGITEDIKMRGFNIILLQIVLLTVISLILSIYKLPVYKKNIIENLKLEKKKFKISKKGFAKKSYNYFLANRIIKVNKRHRRSVFLGISVTVILFSLSTSLYYLAIKSNKMNMEKEIVLTKTYDKNGIEQSDRVINYISKIPGIESMKAVGIIKLKEIEEKDKRKILVLENNNENTKDSKDAQLIICNSKNYRRLKNEIKDKNENLKNTAILMKNNYSTNCTLNNKSEIEIKGKNTTLKLKIIGKLKTGNLTEYNKQVNSKQIRVLVSLDTLKEYEKLFEDNLDSIAITINVDKISEINYFNIKNEALKNGMQFIDKTEKWQQNIFFFRTSLLLGYMGIITIIMIIIVNIIVNEYILAENRKKEFSTMLLLGMDRKRLKKILVIESLVLWRDACVCGGIISIVGVTIEFLYYYFKGDIVGGIPPYWTILIIVIILFPIIIIGKLLGIKSLDFKNLSRLSKQEEEL